MAYGLATLADVASCFSRFSRFLRFTLFAFHAFCVSRFFAFHALFKALASQFYNSCNSLPTRSSAFAQKNI
jgi:hypothetical protein